MKALHRQNLKVAFLIPADLQLEKQDKQTLGSLYLRENLTEKRISH